MQSPGLLASPSPSVYWWLVGPKTHELPSTWPVITWPGGPCGQPDSSQDPKVSCWVPPGTHGLPKWCPKVPKWSLRASRCSQPAGRGPAAGGEALRIRRTPAGGSRVIKRKCIFCKHNLQILHSPRTLPLPPAPAQNHLKKSSKIKHREKHQNVGKVVPKGPPARPKMAKI